MQKKHIASSALFGLVFDLSCAQTFCVIFFFRLVDAFHVSNTSFGLLVGEFNAFISCHDSSIGFVSTSFVFFTFYTLSLPSIDFFLLFLFDP